MTYKIHKKTHENKIIRPIEKKIIIENKETRTRTTNGCGDSIQISIE